MLPVRYAGIFQQKEKIAQPDKVYSRSVGKWVIMQEYARKNPAMIQQPETSQVVEREGLEKQNTWKRWLRRTQRRTKFWAFLQRKILERWTHSDFCVSVVGSEEL